MKRLSMSAKVNPLTCLAHESLIPFLEDEKTRFLRLMQEGGRGLSHIVEAFASIAHDRGVSVELLEVEVCNYDMIEGSSAHQNQVDTHYSRLHYLWMEGSAVDYRRIPDTTRLKPVFLTEAEVTARAVETVKTSAPNNNGRWFTRVSRSSSIEHADEEMKSRLLVFMEGPLSEYERKALDLKTAVSHPATRKPSRM